MSYLTQVKTTVVEALQTVFDGFYPVTQFRNVHTSIEYPEEKQDYPGLWIEYDDTEALMRAGVSHVEYVDPATGDRVPPFTRWRYTGAVSITVVALTSLERDRLYDEVVNVIAFGSQDAERGRFRSLVQANPFVTVDLNYDAVTPGGGSATPGTPWETDEIIYEKTMTIDAIGEFYPAMSTGPVILLSRVQVDTPLLSLSGDLPLSGQATGNTATDWH